MGRPYYCCSDCDSQPSVERPPVPPFDLDTYLSGGYRDA